MKAPAGFLFALVWLGCVTAPGQETAEQAVPEPVVEPSAEAEEESLVIEVQALANEPSLTVAPAGTNLSLALPEPPEPPESFWERLSFDGLMLDLAKPEGRQALFDLTRPVDPEEDLANVVFYGEGKERVRGWRLFNIRF